MCELHLLSQLASMHHLVVAHYYLHLKKTAHVDRAH